VGRVAERSATRVSFTRYLVARHTETDRWCVSLSESSPFSADEVPLTRGVALRYSPIFCAYLAPDQPAPAFPSTPTSIAFFFSRRPHNALGRIRPLLTEKERELTYFTQGLASILCLNCKLQRAKDLSMSMGNVPLEYWPLTSGELDPRRAVVEVPPVGEVPPVPSLAMTGADQEVLIYVEQIKACMATLWHSYKTHNPEELVTLARLTMLTTEILKEYRDLSQRKPADVDCSLATVKGKNALSAALVELAGSLSYAVTQGASGSSPILLNPSPFPHFSLLGIGGEVRALNKFTRYLEKAFSVRDAAKVIFRVYSDKEIPITPNISGYRSGKDYKLDLASEKLREFDRGGELPEDDEVPLVAYFSLRYGFKESKFSLTAASETLTDEVSPQWTLMTLSHEIMHNRVREIFQALFGTDWDNDRDPISLQNYDAFKIWYERGSAAPACDLAQGLRNAVLNFCVAMDRLEAKPIKSERGSATELGIPYGKLNGIYGRNRPRATELFVHFHDYYFTYASQPRLYAMSLWGSWIKVAAPYARPTDYLVRTLATLASGTGLEPSPAFEHARDILDTALGALERSGVSSPLFDEIRSLLNAEEVRPYFYASYYLIDQVSRYFSSPTIRSGIDGIDGDPFAAGLTLTDEYSANVFVYGEDDEEERASPIRYCLASLVKVLRAETPIKDRLWLTAWNALVISSQEVQ